MSAGAPALAHQDDDGDRFYTWQRESFWSVTTLIGGGVPKHLERWAAKLVAELAHSDLTSHGPYAGSMAQVRRWARAGRADVVARQAAGELTSVKLAKLTEPELALRWLKGAPERSRDAAADLGTDVHAEAEATVLHLATETGEAWAAGRALPEWPDRLRPHMTSFVAFLDDWRPVYLATEATVFNRPQAYAGTLDAIMRLELAPGHTLDLVVDYKSGRAVYAEVALQLAAYARAEFIGAPDGVTELPMPAVAAGAVLHLTPAGYQLRLVRIDEPVFAAFQYAREVYRWAKLDAPTVLLQELTPPKRGAE